MYHDKLRLVQQRGWRLLVKKTLDKVAATTILGVTLPITVPIAAAIRLTMGSPVFYSQPRGGFGGSRFRIVKFRTMRNAKPDEPLFTSDAQRLTSVGRFLRATSLDELPQLWNVLRGEMSMVGPRPFVAQYLERYTPDQARRHDVLPGITGWAQINGRNALTWEQKFELDVWYVDHWSLTLDAKILVRTLVNVLRRDGISEVGQVTSTEFMGTQPAS